MTYCFTEKKLFISVKFTERISLTKHNIPQILTCPKTAYVIYLGEHLNRVPILLCFELQYAFPYATLPCFVIQRGNEFSSQDANSWKQRKLMLLKH